MNDTNSQGMQELIERRIEELAKDLGMTIARKAKLLARSGAVDLDTYSHNEWWLPRMLVTAAAKQKWDAVWPKTAPFRTAKSKMWRDITNLQRF